MNDLFLKVAAATPDIRVADPDYNTEHIIECMQKANTEHAKLLVLPELCLTGYTCGVIRRCHLRPEPYSESVR